MATITYKYIPLGDTDVTNEQSRGLSYQFNGYAPVTFSKSVSEYLASLGEDEKIPSFEEILKDCKGVVLFRDLKYVSTDGIPVSNSSNYKSALSSPSSHMFTEMNVEAADEFQMTGSEDRVPHGSTVIEIPVSDTMLGDNLRGAARVDAIVLYGQAYNLDFYSEVQQGTLQSAVPIGLVLFDSNQPEIDPSSEAKGETYLKLTLGISSINVPTEFNDNEHFETWRKFAGSMHVVNNDLLTTSSFVIRGRDVEPSADFEPDGIYAEQLEGGDVVDFNSRVFFTNDVDSNWDRNVDFGSPAKLTVLNRSDPVSDSTRLPQTVIGKVAYTTDSEGYKHGCLEGIHQSFFEYASEKHSGAVYENDWFAKNKTAINLFSESYDYEFKDASYASYLLNAGSKSQVGREYDRINYDSNSACFADGNQIFSKDSIACGNGTNLNTYRSVIRGNTLALNSSNVRSFSKAYSEEECREDDRAVMYDTLIANSDSITIFNRVKGSSDPDWGEYTTRAMNSVINSRGIYLNNTDVSDNIFGTREYGRNLIAGCCDLDLRDADMNVFLGVKGIKSKEQEGLLENSEVHGSKNSIFIGGGVKASRSRNNIVLGLGYVDHGEDQPKQYNTIDTYTMRSGSKTNVSDSVIIGCNCHLTTFWKDIGPYASVNTEVYDSESNVYMFGKGLKNDIRQTYHSGDGLQGPTIIAGWNNQQYYQSGMKKQIVIGAGPHTSKDIPDFKYNNFELSNYKMKLPNPEVDEIGNQYEVWNRESVVTLTDIKGRTVDYGSNGIQLGFLKGRRSDVNYGDYNFFPYGRINLFKLYSLLQRIRWIPGSVIGSDGNPKENAGYLVFDSSMAGGDTPTGSLSALYTNRSCPWDSWAYNPYAGSGGAWTTCLADLVDDNYAKLKFSPQKPVES